MKFKKEALRKIIQEELQAVLSEQKTQYNFKLLDKVMSSKNRLGRFKKCETGGGFMGLKMGCMGKDVATMQALINKWFEKNVPEAQKWKEQTGKAIINVDGLYGKDTAEALAFVYNSKAEEPGPVMRRSYDAGVDRVMASLDSSDINNVEREVAMVTDPKAMVARKSGEELKDVDTALAKAKFDDQKPTATPPGKEEPVNLGVLEPLRGLKLPAEEDPEDLKKAFINESFKRFL
jgi:hypothetical protein